MLRGSSRPNMYGGKAIMYDDGVALDAEADPLRQPGDEEAMTRKQDIYFEGTFEKAPPRLRGVYLARVYLLSAFVLVLALADMAVVAWDLMPALNSSSDVSSASGALLIVSVILIVVVAGVLVVFPDIANSGCMTWTLLIVFVVALSYLGQFVVMLEDDDEYRHNVVYATSVVVGTFALFSIEAVLAPSVIARSSWSPYVSPAVIAVLLGLFAGVGTSLKSYALLFMLVAVVFTWLMWYTIYAATFNTNVRHISFGALRVLVEVFTLVGPVIRGCRSCLTNPGDDD